LPELPSPGAVLRVEFKIADGASIEAGSRFFLSYTGGPPSGADLNTLAAAVASQFTTHLAAIVSTAETLTDVIITDLSSDTGAIGTWTGTNDGTRSGTQNIANAAATVNHAVSRRYRGGRPRTYLRCGTESDLSGTNEWTSGARTAFLEAWEAWIAAILATTGIGVTLTNIVNVSWYKGNTVFTTPTGRARNIPTLRTTPVVDPITSSIVAQKVGSQRRRLDI